MCAGMAADFRLYRLIPVRRVFNDDTLIEILVIEIFVRVRYTKYVRVGRRPAGR